MDYSQDPIALLANLCQIASFDMNVSEVTNDQLVKKLEKQDLVLDQQTNDYLKKIIEQNEKILEILRSSKK